MNPSGTSRNRPLVPPTVLPCGDAALAVEFGDTIDPRLNARVLALDARLAGHPGIVETVPTYRSLLVHYDPLATDFAGLSAALLALAEDLPDEPRNGRLWRVPVVYGGDFGSTSMTSPAATGWRRTSSSAGTRPRPTAST